MKRFVTIAVCMIIVCGIVTTSLADGVDKSMFEKMDGYSYDKFNKTWSYYQAYSHQYSDASVVVGIELDGGDVEQMPPYVYCWIRDEKNSSILYEVNKLMFLIGDDLYTFETLLPSDSSSSALLGEEAKDFLQALSNGNSMTIRLVYKTGNTDEEVLSSEYKKTFKVAAKAILDSNVWDFVSDEWKQLSTHFAPTKE